MKLTDTRILNFRDALEDVNNVGDVASVRRYHGLYEEDEDEDDLIFALIEMLIESGVVVDPGPRT